MASTRTITVLEAVREAQQHEQAGRFAEARTVYEAVLGVTPARAPILHQLGMIAAAEGDLATGIQRLAEAIDADPRFAAAYSNLGNLLRDDCRLDEAIAAYRTAMMLDPTLTVAHRNLLLSLLYVPGLTQEQRFAEHVAFGSRHAAAEMLPPPRPDRDPERRLRIGIVSSDFRVHSTGRNIMPLFEHRDRATYDLICYAEIDKPDGYTARFQAHADGWRSTVGLTDRAVAELVRTDAVDILMVLAGVFDRNRPLVACYRPAPIQIAALDAATSGIPAFDYFLSDPVMSPPQGTERFVERLVRIPAVIRWEPLETAPPLAAPPALANRFVTFGSFNNPIKISTAAIALWSAALHAVPSARLMLKFRNRFADPSLRARFRIAFGAHGVAPERLLFGGGGSDMQHLSAYNQVDIAFDTLPFAGVNTTFDALWMGVPVLALAGDSMMSRMSASVLHAVGLDDLVADSPEQFVARAVALAGDLPALTQLRAGLRDRVRSSPVCDGPGFARALEALWRTLWRDWCAASADAGEPPSHPAPAAAEPAAAAPAWYARWRRK